MTETKLIDWLQRQPGTNGIGDDCFILTMGRMFGEDLPGGLVFSGNAEAAGD